MCNNMQLKFWNKTDQPGVEICVIMKKYFAHVPTDCRCPLKIYRHSYFPEAASAGLRFIKSSGDAKNSHLLKFHWRFQAGRQLKGQFAEAGNPCTAFVYRRSAFSLNTTIYRELRGFALRAETNFSVRSVGPCPRTVPGAF